MMTRQRWEDRKEDIQLIEKKERQIHDAVHDMIRLMKIIAEILKTITIDTTTKIVT